MPANALKTDMEKVISKGSPKNNQKEDSVNLILRQYLLNVKLFVPLPVNKQREMLVSELNAF